MKVGSLVESFWLDFKEAVEKAAEFGAQGIQTYVKEIIPDSEIKEKLDIVKANGLVVTALCGEMCGFADTDEHPEKIELFKKIMDIALKFETNIVTCHIGTITAEPSEQNEIIYRACREIADYGKSIGVTLAIETGPEPAAVLFDFLERFGPGNGIGVNLDPANLVMVSGDNAAEAVRILGKYIVHTHAKDGYMIGNKEGRKEKVLGYGDVNYNEYIPALASVGYDGFLTIERDGGDDRVGDIKKEIEFLYEKLDKFGLRS